MQTRFRFTRKYDILMLVVFLLSLSFMRQAEGALLFSYGLDSLVYMSEEIAEATIGQSHKSNWGTQVVEVKISAVYKGKLKIGGTVEVCDLYLYRKPKPGDPYGNTQPLVPGDKLILFLVQLKGRPSRNAPESSRTYWTVNSGVKLLSKGKVFGFRQYYENPGPYVAECTENFPKKKFPTEKGFRAALRKKIQEMTKLKKALQTKKMPDDLAWFLNTLKERPEPKGFDNRDHIAERICVAIANTRDPGAIDRALRIKQSGYGARILGFGLGSPKGREFLLKKVANPKEPLKRRIRFAHIIRYTGEVYGHTFTKIGASSLVPQGVVTAGNSGYITRIARIALEQRRHPGLACALVSEIDYFTQRIAQTKDKDVVSDFYAAVAVLAKLHKATRSERLRFDIERATSHTADHLYARLKSPCAGIISIVEPVDQSRYTRSSERVYVFRYSIVTGHARVEGKGTKGSLVLENVGSGRRHVLSLRREIAVRASSGQGGSNSVLLPRNLPCGRYRLYLQFKDGSKVVSRGHYMEVDL